MILANWTDDEIADALPHGSGIDCDWRIDRKGNRVFTYNSFHVMSEHGYYDGWQDFQVIIFAHKKDVLHALTGPCAGQFQVLHRAGDIDCKVQSVGGWRRDSSAYGLADYLTEIVDYALREAGIVTKS